MAEIPKPFTRSQSEDTYRETSAQSQTSSNQSSFDENGAHRPISQLVSTELEQHTGQTLVNPTPVPQTILEQQQHRTALITAPDNYQLQDDSTMQVPRLFSETLPEEEVRRKPYAHPESQPSSSDESTVPRSTSSSGSRQGSETPGESDDEQSENNIRSPIPELNGVGPIFSDCATVNVDRKEICNEICGYKSNKLKWNVSMSLGGLKPKVVIKIEPQHNRENRDHIKVDVYVIIPENKSATRKLLQQKLWQLYRNCFMRVCITLKDLHSGQQFVCSKYDAIGPNDVHKCFKFTKVAPHIDIIRSHSESLTLEVTAEIIGMEKVMMHHNSTSDYVEVDFQKSVI